MDARLEFLTQLKRQHRTQGNFLGLLNVLIGRRIVDRDGAPVTEGITWRTLSATLKQVRWDKHAVRDLGLDPAQLPPRDRERFWYQAIAQARVDSEAATKAGDRFTEQLRRLGYASGSSPQ